MRFVHISLTILLSLSLLNAKLSVRAPQVLRDEFDKTNGIDYISLVPADKIDIDKITVGTLVLADPETACSDLKMPASDDKENIVQKPIIIARRGECAFAQKTRVAELAGAQMLIIVNNLAQIDPDSRHRKISQAHIEVVEISKTSGDKLIDFLKKYKDDNVELFFKLETHKSGIDIIRGNSSKVELQYWYSSSDSTGGTYEFIGHLRDLHNKFGGLLDILFHNVLYRCHTCMRKGGDLVQQEGCVSNGKYCDPEPTHSKHRGSRVIIEDLRQHCMHENTIAENFWNFLTYYGTNCIVRDDNELDECIEAAYLAIGMPKDDQDDIHNCMINSFEKKFDLKNIETNPTDNSILSEDYNLQRKMGISHYPALYVNGNRYEGSLKNVKSVFDFICKHYLVQPIACREAGSTAVVTTTYSFGFTVLMILGTVTAMLAMIYCVRRMVRRKIMVEMKDEISNTIAQYSKLRDRNES